MPYKIPLLDYRNMLRLIERYPEGATRQQIGQGLRFPLPARSLQRRLARLMTEGWIVASGRARQTAYRLAPGRRIPADWPNPFPVPILNQTGTPTPAVSAASSAMRPAPSAVPRAAPPIPAAQPAASGGPATAMPTPATTRAAALPPNAAPPSAGPVRVNSPAPPSVSAAVPPARVPTPPAPSPPSAPPMTAKEHAKFDEYLQQLIPLIVASGMRPQDARGYIARVAENLSGAADDARFRAVAESELNSLNETTCAAYGITPDALATWKRKWERR